MNPMLVIAKETLNILREQYRKLKNESDHLGHPEPQWMWDEMRDLERRGKAVKEAIQIMERVLESKPQGPYKVVDSNITAEEAEKLFS